MKAWGSVAAVIAFAVALPMMLAAVVASAILPATTAGAACTATTTAAGAWRPPLIGTYRVTSGFGLRFHPILRRTKLHTGIDLVAARDRTVVAAAAGTVLTAGYDTAYGNQVVIDHGDGLQTRYGHMATQPAVATGQHVAAGTRLGVEGQTGYATGIHLHFEVIRGGHPIDPRPFMADHGAPLNGDTTLTSTTGSSDDIVAGRSDGQQVTLRGEQVTNAATIIRVGHAAHAPERGIVVALMAALQESGLRNLNYGDRDSLGLFQQRASWGTAAERQTPAYAARAFYGGADGPNQGSPAGLLDLDDWQSLGLGQAAQAVQISAFPTRYDRWAPVARAILTRLGGGTSGDCALVGVGSLRVATWNVCLEFCPDLAPWQQRVPVLARELLATGADVIALQETGRHHPQGDALARALSSRYTVAAYHRSKMILTNPDRLATTSPDGRQLPGRGFVIDGRGGVAQVLRFKATGAEIVVTSLHPVTGSTPSADQQRLSYVRQAHAIAVSLSASGRRRILHAGDLNSYLPGHGTHRTVADYLYARGYVSAEHLARTRDGARLASYNGGHPPKPGRRIDHIVVTPDTAVSSWRQVLAADSQHPPSDHHLIVTDLQPRE